MESLAEFLATRATELGVPGAAGGVLLEGRDMCAVHGVTSVENPLPVDDDTLFHIGSITKTYTATAMMTLVARGDLDLNEPARRYVPELRLPDASATVAQLLNHSAGWSDFEEYDTGEGDDALAALVARMAELTQVSPPEARAVYNNAGFALSGRIIEKLTGTTYEQAMRSLVLEPIGLSQSFLLPNEVMTRRFAVGHNIGADGSVAPARPWKSPRSANPAGGLTSTVGDQLRWARFHVGDGTTADGRRILPKELLARMQEPTVGLFGSAMGDAVGISWLLRDVDGSATVGHAGGMESQFSQLLMVPERDFAVVVVANSAPNGIELTNDVVRWALSTHLGLIDRDVEPLPFDETQARALDGTYETETLRVTIRVQDSQMSFDFEVKPDSHIDTGDGVPSFPPCRLGLLAGAGDQYVLTDGPFKGMRGVFTRDAEGTVVAIDFNSRPYTRVLPS